MTGKVYLVGAGPGDDRLLTLRARELIDSADVIVYDSLVGQGILAMIPQDTRTIYVGKRAGNHAMPQEEINGTLLAQAQKGLKVVRLKGGDPFLFGRGGEELVLLNEAGIPYEIVPGIPSPIAVPAYNGIPVTHRDYVSSVHIITGHRKAGVEDQIDYEALVRCQGTLVFLMGLSAMPHICQSLIAAGMPADMPAAVLQQGTTAEQAKVVATLATLDEEVQRAGIHTPAIIVVGQVCSLSGEFAWYEKMPLFGSKVLVTRPRKRSSVMAAKLKNLGAQVLEIPAIRTVEMEDCDQLEVVLQQVDTYSWVAFTSPFGVEVFFHKLMKLNRDIRCMAHMQFATIGQGTAKALKKYGICPDLIPTKYEGEELARALCQVCQPGERLLLPRAKQGGQELVDILDKAGIVVSDIPIYDTQYEESPLIDLNEEFARGDMLCAAFTSASTVRGFVKAAGDMDYRLVTAACIGEKTRAEAQRYGMKTYVADEATMDALARLIVEIRGGRTDED